MIFDKKGNIWFNFQIEFETKYEDNHSIETIAEGLCYYDGNKFSIMQGLPDTNTGPLLIDKNENLWIDTEWGGVRCFDGKNLTIYDTSQGFSNNNILSIFQDNNGIMWFGTYAGLCSFDGKSISTYTKAQGLKNDAVLGIEQDNSNYLWLGTWGGGIYSWNSGELINYTTEQGLPNNTILPTVLKPMIKDSKGNIWFITWLGGVSKFDGHKITRYDKELANYYIHSICEDKKGNIWFGVNDTVIRYDGKAFKTYSLRNDSCKNSVLIIIEGADGDIYFSTSDEGIVRYDGKTFANLF